VHLLVKSVDIILLTLILV